MTKTQPSFGGTAQTRRGWLKGASALIAIVAVMTWAPAAIRAETKTIARCGEGFLEEVDGNLVLHVKGTPYEMGYQHGALLKDHVRSLVRYLFDVKAKELDAEIPGTKIKIDAYKVILGITEKQRKYVPARYYEELRGLADGSGMKEEEIIVSNFIPEMFHCSGFAIAGKATKNGELYHGRILDYACDWRLQEHALVIIAEPKGFRPFVNVSYAGFIGSVTGMNANSVSIGEMGGAGLGHWDGVPMAFLVRRALEESDSLDQAVAVFRDNPRTCEYYYVIADGKIGQAVGMEASWDKFTVVKMGESHKKLPTAIPDAVVLSADKRYEELVRRVQAGHGAFTPESARKLMDRPVAMKSNLHSVLFETKSTKFWVANASKAGDPAATQPYHPYQLSELLKHQPQTSAPAIPCPSNPKTATR